MKNSFRDTHCQTILKVLPICQIDITDKTYATAPDWLVNQNLCKSIDLVGITNPILVQESVEQPFRVVCGFQRLRLAIELGATTIPSLITKEKDSRQLFDLALFDNLGTRKLSDIEKARAIAKLRYELKVDEEEIITNYLPALSLRPDRFHYQRFLSTDRLPSVIKKNLSSLSVEISLRLTRWKNNEQKFFLDIIEYYRPSRSNLKKLFGLLDELRVQPGSQTKVRSIFEIWNQSDCDDINQKSSENKVTSFKKILKALYQSRYPEFSEMTSRYEKNLRSLNLPPKVRVGLPPYFEGQNLTFKFSISSPAQLAKISKRLSLVANETELAEIFKLL